MPDPVAVGQLAVDPPASMGSLDGMPVGTDDGPQSFRALELIASALGYEPTNDDNWQQDDDDAGDDADMLSSPFGRSHQV